MERGKEDKDGGVRREGVDEEGERWKGKGGEGSEAFRRSR